MPLAYWDHSRSSRCAPHMMAGVESETSFEHGREELKLADLQVPAKAVEPPAERSRVRLFLNNRKGNVPRNLGSQPVRDRRRRIDSLALMRQGATQNVSFENLIVKKHVSSPGSRHAAAQCSTSRMRAKRLLSPLLAHKLRKTQQKWGRTDLSAVNSCLRR
jgi:hypothetical protein